jgi:uncharacterized membrane protein YoaK (UPF0700 family)
MTGMAASQPSGFDQEALRRAAASVRHPLTRSAGLPVIAPIVSLVSFVVGAAAGGVLVRRLATRHGKHIRAALLIEASMVGAAAILTAAVSVHPNTAAGDIVIGLLACAMGVRSATVRRLGVPDLTTTVLTMTLTGLASDARIVGGPGQGSIRRTAAVVTMFAGALVGALLVQTSLVLPLGVAAGLAVLTWMMYAPAARRVS